MTQQNHPTLLEQARLTDAEIGRAGADIVSAGTDGSMYFAGNAHQVANAATRKAFEVVIARGRAIGDSHVRGFVDALEAQYKEVQK